MGSVGGMLAGTDASKTPTSPAANVPTSPPVQPTHQRTATNRQATHRAHPPSKATHPYPRLHLPPSPKSTHPPAAPNNHPRTPKQDPQTRCANFGANFGANFAWMLRGFPGGFAVVLQYFSSAEKFARPAAVLFALFFVPKTGFSRSEVGYVSRVVRALRSRRPSWLPVRHLPACHEFGLGGAPGPPPQPLQMRTAARTQRVRRTTCARGQGRLRPRRRRR